MRRILIIIVIGVVLIGFLFVIASLFRREDGAKKAKGQVITLTYYRFGESPNVISSQIQEYSKKNKNIKVLIKDFYNLEEYENRIINELAEGRGPDIFSIPNTWMYQHIKKINPLPVDMMNVEKFRQTFVDTVDRDVVRPDGTGALRIFGFPLFVDTLALYYNKDHFEDRLAVRGRPAQTWSEFAQDVFQLTKSSGGVVEVAGAAIGRADNISSGVDILYALMLQMKTQFYGKNNTVATFGSTQKSSSGEVVSPGVEALALFVSFAEPSSKNYSWNAHLTDPQSSEKELAIFAQGKVSVIVGYSSTYQKIVDAISQSLEQKKETIQKTAIRTAEFPQIFDPKTASIKRETLARYFVETVSRTSQHPREAWDLLVFLSSQQNMRTYNALTKRPTSRRDLIEEQKKDPLYGIFAAQSAFGTSVALYDDKRFSPVLSDAIHHVTDEQETASSALKKAEEAVSAFLPEEGFLGPGPYVATPQKNPPKK